MDAPEGKLRVGDSVWLTRDVEGAPAGAGGRVLGFLRREPELVVISLTDGRILRIGLGVLTKATSAH